MQKTFSIIKPDAVKAGNAGKILAHLEAAGFRVAALKMVKLSKPQAEGFYAVHRERPFFNSLVTFMTEGPVIVMALEREDAVKKLREVMGATNPANADAGTIRKLYAESIERNSIHGSDAPETAAEELKYFFTTQELNQI
ncbi:MAG TPA: nucleoside-diphosphate kinase [Bryobacteraceae bacterium]|nr:nucleoside-diphosphate kinase [Bryobacteraceae bacterium]HVY92717.1 nucleoside-diphosphate kinase [Bryobacteraceae bacterium]